VGRVAPQPRARLLELGRRGDIGGETRRLALAERTLLVVVLAASNDVVGHAAILAQRPILASCCS
jgi:hypothetical protein